MLGGRHIVGTVFSYILANTYIYKINMYILHIIYIYIHCICIICKYMYTHILIHKMYTVYIHPERITTRCSIPGSLPPRSNVA
jgi:hypothetical protein